MWSSIIAVLVSSIAALVGILGKRDEAGTKKILVTLAVSGLVIGICSAVANELGRRDAKTKHDAEVKDLNDRLDYARDTIDALGISVGDLAALEKISSGKKYYVRIATAKDPRELADIEATAGRIEKEFPSIQGKGMLAVLVPSGHPSWHVLAFGRGLSMTGAEVFLRFAVAHNLANGQPQVFTED